MRYFSSVETTALNAAENTAKAWDTSGDGTGTFEEGAPLSDDGGSTITHRACNTLTSPIDTSRVLEAFTKTPLYDLYRLDADLSPGTVERYDSTDWNEIGSGNLQEIVLSDAGLEIYNTDTIT